MLCYGAKGGGGLEVNDGDDPSLLVMMMMMTMVNLRIMVVATVNEEGSSCSKLAANFSQLDFAMHNMHRHIAPCNILQYIGYAYYTFASQYRMEPQLSIPHIAILQRSGSCLSLAGLCC